MQTNKKKQKTPGHFRFMWGLTKGVRSKYVIFLSFTIISVFLNVVNVFIAKLLVDSVSTTNGILNILNDEMIGPIGVFIRDILGGGNHLANNLWIFAIIIASIGILTLGASFCRIYFRGKAGNYITKKIQMMLFEHIEKIPYSKFKKFKSGDIIQTCTRDQQLVRRTMSMQLGMVVWTSFTIIFAFIFLVSINWIVALVSVAFVPILFIYSFFVIKKVNRLYRKVDDSEGRLMSKIEENLASVRTVKVYNNEEYEVRDFDKYINDYSGHFIRLRLFSGFYASSSDIFVIGQLILSIAVTGALAFNGLITVGALLLVFSYVNMIVWPLRDVAQVLSNLAQTFASIDRMKLILNEPIEDMDTGVKDNPIYGNIVCRDVFYRYDDSDLHALHGINLEIKRGETVAIIGKTGSGKSTFVHLLSALFDYTSGSITLDGVELRDYSKQYLRQNVASVLQDPYLFAKTVIGNLRLVNDSISSSQIEQALGIAHLQRTIEKLPRGLETEIGEKGATLSGGQKQRLSIARSLIQNAPIMIFDDSLSALDTQTDAAIRARLKETKKESTTIIITHRMQTAKDSDKIIVFDNGTIEAIGTHEELIKQNGIYKRVYELQTGIFEKETN